MLKSRLRKIIFVNLFLLILTLFIQNSCSDDNITPSPITNGSLTGGWNTSPEDSIVQIIVDEFQEQFQVKAPHINFYDGDISGFLNVLENTYNTYKHLDYCAFYADDLDTLIAGEWLQAYPLSINESDYIDMAIRSMRNKSEYYGVPIYVTKEGRVKGIGVGFHLEDSLRSILLNFVGYVSNSKNSVRIAEAVGGIPARKSLLPDLVPVPDSVFNSFCVRDVNGNLIVTIENQGNSTSFPSTTEVNFSGAGQTVSASTPSLKPGESVILLFEIPANCFGPDCGFQISVDVLNDVPETDEQNNIVFDSCIG